MTAAQSSAAAAVLLAAAALLTACGGDDSTVSGQPSSETLAPPPGDAGATRQERTPATRDEGRYTEAPQSVPADAPGYTAPAVGPREKGYLTALEKQGVKTAPLSDELVAAGNTICRIRTTGGAAGETTTIADAVAGQIVAGGYSDRKVEDVSRSVVDSASGQLCP